jgi:hypothetical protein
LQPRLSILSFGYPVKKIDQGSAGCARISQPSGDLNRPGVSGDSLVAEGALGVTDGIPFGVAVAERVGPAGVVVAVAGAQVGAEAACDALDRPVAELVPTDGSRVLEVRQ